MSDELRKAAERRRKPYPRASVSGGKDYIAPWVHKQEWDDLNKLADDYLDEHPADDDTPIDEAWLMAVGGTNIRINGCGRVILFRMPSLGCDSQWVEWDSMSEFVSMCRRSDEMEERDLPPDIVTTKIKTRGPFRGLCKSVGIPLKEVNP